MTALEIWDLEVRGDTLFAARDEPDFAARLAEGIDAIRRGEAQTRSRITLPEACRAIDAIFAGGGGVTGAIEAALRAIGLPFHRGDAFAGEAGGLDLLDAIGSRSGLVVDVGQSAIKISARGGRVRIDRDFQRLPVTRPLGDRGDPRDPFRDFVAASVAAAMRDFGEADALVLALPAELDDDGRPEGSSYPGLQGDRELAAEVLKRAGIPGARAILLNDAELCALSARRVVPARSTALVLTIGFGIGGALLLPRG
ncbi:MAG: hypothetical protein ABJE95_27415 [Byssovorax sp.]